jgi:hypothetical protein
MADDVGRGGTFKFIEFVISQYLDTDEANRRLEVCRCCCICCCCCCCCDIIAQTAIQSASKDLSEKKTTQCLTPFTSPLLADGTRSPATRQGRAVTAH